MVLWNFVWISDGRLTLFTLYGKVIYTFLSLFCQSNDSYMWQVHYFDIILRWLQSSSWVWALHYWWMWQVQCINRRPAVLDLVIILVTRDLYSRPFLFLFSVSWLMMLNKVLLCVLGRTREIDPVCCSVSPPEKYHLQS